MYFKVERGGHKMVFQIFKILFCLRVFFEIGVLTNKVEMRLEQMCFPVNIAKLLKTAVFKEHLRGLFLLVQKSSENDFEKMRHSLILQATVISKTYSTMICDTWMSG